MTVPSTDFNRDEVRRQLRDADELQRSSMTGFRDALHRIFHSKDMPTSAKAELLGSPQRRQFLKIGGATVLGAAVLAACGSDDDKSSSASSTSTTAAGSGTGAGAKMDVVLARTAASLENLAVAVYSVALGESSTKLPADITFDPAVVDAAKLFRDHHKAHAEALNQVLTSVGAKAYTKPNPYVFENVVQPKLKTLTDQTKVVMFAQDLENIAAGTYAYACGVLSTADLRKTIISIGGVESRHATALSLVLDPTGKNAVPRSFIDAGPDGRVPQQGILTTG